VAGGEVEIDGEAAVGVQPLQRAREALDRFCDERPGAGRRAGRRSTRLCEVVVDLPAHPFYLLVDGGGEIGLTGRPGVRRFLAQDSERRLQSVVASWCASAASSTINTRTVVSGPRAFIAQASLNGS
jgi:hypothetical protein